MFHVTINEGFVAKNVANDNISLLRGACLIQTPFFLKRGIRFVEVRTGYG
jgi:hypothetical protein